MEIVSLQYTEDIAAINYQSPPPPNSLIQTSFEYKPIVYRLDLDETRQNIRFNFLFIKKIKIHRCTSRRYSEWNVVDRKYTKLISRGFGSCNHISDCIDLL